MASGSVFQGFNLKLRGLQQRHRNSKEHRGRGRGRGSWQVGLEKAQTRGTKAEPSKSSTAARVQMKVPPLDPSLASKTLPLHRKISTLTHQCIHAIATSHLNDLQTQTSSTRSLHLIPTEPSSALPPTPTPLTLILSITQPLGC